MTNEELAKKMFVGLLRTIGAMIVIFVIVVGIVTIAEGG